MKLVYTFAEVNANTNSNKKFFGAIMATEVFKEWVGADIHAEIAKIAADQDIGAIEQLEQAMELSPAMADYVSVDRETKTVSIGVDEAMYLRFMEVHDEVLALAVPAIISGARVAKAIAPYAKLIKNTIAYALDQFGKATRLFLKNTAAPEMNEFVSEFTKFREALKKVDFDYVISGTRKPAEDAAEEAKED